MKVSFVSLFLIGTLSCMSFVIHSQVLVKCILINKADSTLIPNALINLVEYNKQIVTNQNGEFEFVVPQDAVNVKLSITAIGVRERVQHKLTFVRPEKVYVNVSTTNLDGVTIRYLSPYEIVKKAVSVINENYACKSYFGHAHYRQYQKQNGSFQNLFEANPIIMFQIDSKNKYLTASEAFAARFNRQSLYKSNKVSDDQIHIAELLKENPIYHIDRSSILPSKLCSYFFQFDSISADNEYRINYHSNYSSETHGWDNYHLQDYTGESYEIGQLIIDKSTLAFKSIHRHAYRYPNYHYPKNNNFLRPSLKFYVEFVDAILNISFFQSNDSWYLKDINHMYTLEYYDVYTSKKTYEISEAYELTFDSVSSSIEYTYHNKFFPKLLNTATYTDSMKEALDFTYYFFPKNKVWLHLSKDGPVESQFLNTTKPH